MEQGEAPGLNGLPMTEVTGTTRTAVCVIRVWADNASPYGLRARITTAGDSEVGDEATTVVASREEICDVVDDWLADLLRL